jgi:ubiquinone/menaquinone biosynthesis C-methylase UbiE
VDARALDLGCGTAGTGVALALEGVSVTGVDLSAQLLSLAQIRAAEEGAQLSLVRGDALCLPFRDAAFDLCVCDQVIEHVAGYGTLLAEAYRVLRPGGLLLLSAPHRLALREGHTGLLFASWLPRGWAARYAALRGRRMPGEPWDVRLELPWTVRRRLREAGFDEIRSPWRQPRRDSAQGGAARRLLARIRPLVSLVRWGFRWRQLLLSTLMFVLIKPSAESGPKAAGRGT